jgi:hypothetical protein
MSNLPDDVTHGHRYFWQRDEDEEPSEPDYGDYDDREEE